MSATTFLAALALLETRISGIGTDQGFHFDLGASVYVEGLVPVPVDDQQLPWPGSVVIDPGTSSATPNSGEIRASTARVEAIFERTISVVAAWPIEDKARWLEYEQKIGADLRRAILVDQSAYHSIGVQRITPTEQESNWPQAGSKVLFVKSDFSLRYVES